MIKIQFLRLPELVIDKTFEQLKSIAHGPGKYILPSKDFRIVGIIKGEKENDKNY